MKPTWTPSEMRILYLEDEAIIALETVEVLRDLGFRSIGLAHSLAMADRILQEDKVDLALLDVNLSHGRTSFDLGRRLQDSGVPVVFATGYSRASLPQDLCRQVVEKPFAADTLEDALQEAVEAAS